MTDLLTQDDGMTGEQMAQLARRIAGPDGKYGGLPLTRNDIVHLAEAYLVATAALADFAPFLKDDETPIERLRRERADTDWLTGALAREKARAEQAEAELTTLQQEKAALEARAIEQQVRNGDLCGQIVEMGTANLQLEQSRDDHLRVRRNTEASLSDVTSALTAERETATRLRKALEKARAREQAVAAALQKYGSHVECSWDWRDDSPVCTCGYRDALDVADEQLRVPRPYSTEVRWVPGHWLQGEAAAPPDPTTCPHARTTCGDCQTVFTKTPEQAR